MQGKYKTKKCSKGIKRTKIKKYDEGTEEVKLPTLNDGVGLAGAAGSALIEGTTQHNFDSRYTNQLKDENQAIGRGIGAAAGMGLNLVAPGLGTALTPVLSSAGGAIQRGFQKNKLEELKAQGKLEDAMEKSNSGIRTDLTSFQAKQYSKGSNKLKTKVIEIEGKGTPEIHTDKNFNIKNLGTTPHSKGGDKVLAEEGDIVFPTQNSSKKYNEIMTAIKNKDKYKLKKEQNKLPEDKVKYAKGGTVGNKEKRQAYLEEEAKKYGYTPEQIDKLDSTTPNWRSQTTFKNALNRLSGSTERYNPLEPNKESKQNKVTNSNQVPLAPKQPSTFNYLSSPLTSKNQKGAANTTRTTGVNASVSNKSGGVSSDIQALNDANGIPMYFDENNRNQKYSGASEWNTPGAMNLTAHDPRNPYGKNNLPVRAIPLGNNKFRYYQNPTGIEPMQPKSSLNVDLGSVPDKLDTIPTTPNTGIPEDKGKPKSGLGLNTGLFEYAPTAYNLGQGLFGNVEKVRRKEYNPKLEDYVDTSSNLRREINQGYKANVANSRNLSGGLASNARANAQSAVNNKIAQINSVDSNEYGKQLDVNNRNVGRINEGRQINFNAFNTYEDLDAQNRAKKSEALAQGLTSIGDIAARDKLYKNNLQAAQINSKGLEAGRSYGQGFTTDGTKITDYDYSFNPERATGISPTLTSNIGVNKKIRKQSKGNKSIQVTRKYKLKG